MARDLLHVEGIRGVLVIWVFLHHILPRSSPFISRGEVAVSFFVLLSGFVTHRTQHGRLIQTRWELWCYSFRRLDRICLVSWLGMIISLAIENDAFPRTPGRLVQCFAFVEPRWWDPTRGGCPDMPLWVIGVLVPCWLVYPLVQRLVVRCEALGGAVSRPRRAWPHRVGPRHHPDDEHLGVSRWPPLFCPAQLLLLLAALPNGG